MDTALALLEFRSIALGIQAGDAMVKRAAVETFALGTVQPGHFLIAVGGDVASVEEAWQAGREVAGGALAAEVYLPDAHPALSAALVESTREFVGDALGAFETVTVAATLHGADRALKETTVTLAELRLADGLGGKGYALFSGGVGEIDAALVVATAAVSEEEVVASVAISQLHDEVSERLGRAATFAGQPDLAERRRGVATRKTSPRKRTARKTATRRKTR